MHTGIIAFSKLNKSYKLVFKVFKMIMNKMGLKANKRNQRKYSSYRGTVGKIIPIKDKESKFNERRCCDHEYDEISYM